MLMIISAQSKFLPATPEQPHVQYHRCRLCSIDGKQSSRHEATSLHHNSELMSCGSNIATYSVQGESIVSCEHLSPWWGVTSYHAGGHKGRYIGS